MKKIGKAILKIRKKNKISQTDMATHLGVTRQAVSNWERGLTYPDIETLNKISKIYNVSIDKLMNGKVYDINIEKKIKRINLILFLVVITSYLYLIITGDNVIFQSIYLISAVPTYLLLELIMKTGSYTLLAGYDGTKDYDEDNLKRLLLEINFGILLITVSQLTLELLLSLSNVNYQNLKLTFLTIYFINFFIVIIIVNHRNKDKIKKDA